MELCSYGEIMLVFIVDFMGKNVLGIFDILMNIKYFLLKFVSVFLYELLYKIFGNSNFKLLFVKVFVFYYFKFFEDFVVVESVVIGIMLVNKYSEYVIFNSFFV